MRVYTYIYIHIYIYILFSCAWEGLLTQIKMVNIDLFKGV